MKYCCNQYFFTPDQAAELYAIQHTAGRCRRSSRRTLTLSSIDLYCRMVAPAPPSPAPTSLPRKSPVPPTERPSLASSLHDPRFPLSIDTVARTIQLFPVHCPHLTLCLPTVPPSSHVSCCTTTVSPSHFLQLFTSATMSVLNSLPHFFYGTVAHKTLRTTVLPTEPQKSFGTIIRTFIGTVTRTAPKQGQYGYDD